MNTIQIKYFLTAAEYLNFTKAAERLFISQPALSKQLHVMEEELEMMLFRREGKKMTLTPAGKVLYDELKEFDKNYDAIIHKARLANEGSSGLLRIGLLEGQLLSDSFINTYQQFIAEYPNIDFRLSRASFSKLRNCLYNEEIDLAVTLSFDVERDSALRHIKIQQNDAFFLISKRHPLADKEINCWPQLADELFIFIDPKDSLGGAQEIIKECVNLGFDPKIDYAPSLESAMLWVEAGLGIGVFDSNNYLTLNPNIKKLELNGFHGTYTAIAWYPDNLNPIAAKFLELLK